MAHDFKAVCDRILELHADETINTKPLDGFIFWRKQWLGDRVVSLMNWRARGIHFHLILASLEEEIPCSFPDDGLTMAGHVGHPEDWAVIWPMLEKAWKRYKGRLWQIGTARTYLKQIDKRQVRKISGEKGAAARWNQEPDPAQAQMAIATDPIANAIASPAPDSVLPEDLETAAAGSEAIAIATRTNGNSQGSGWQKPSKPVQEEVEEEQEKKDNERRLPSRVRAREASPKSAAAAARSLEYVETLQQAFQKATGSSRLIGSLFAEDLAREMARGVPIEVLVQQVRIVAARELAKGTVIGSYGYLHPAVLEAAEKWASDPSAREREPGSMPLTLYRVHAIDRLRTPGFFAAEGETVEGKPFTFELATEREIERAIRAVERSETVEEAEAAVKALTSRAERRRQELTDSGRVQAHP